jgi:hypothetical protein
MATTHTNVNKALSKKYGVEAHKKPGSEVIRLSYKERFAGTAYTPKEVKPDAEFDPLAVERDPIKTSLGYGEVTYNNCIGRIERSLKRMKAVFEFTEDKFFKIFVDSMKDSDYYTVFFLGTAIDHNTNERLFTVLDSDEREIICVEQNELSDIMSWLVGFNKLDGRGKLLLRTDLIEE